MSQTFTGPFVYCIQPVLPKSATKSILEKIGYQLKTDTEYRQMNNTDPEKAMRMGFELFLARIECEYLVEAMSQKSHLECLEILQRRAVIAPPSQMGADETVKDTGIDTSQMENEEGRLSVGCSLVDPGPVETNQGDLTSETQGTPNTPDRQPDDPQIPLNLELQPLEKIQTHSSGTRPTSAFLNDDRSILEMQKNYPDLAIRQKPIFSSPKPLGPKPGACGRHFKERTPEGSSAANKADLDRSGPQSMHTIAPEPNLPGAVIVTKHQPTEGKSHKVTSQLHRASPSEVPRYREEVKDPESQAEEEDCDLRELAERMGQQQDHRVDENLKYPVEETVPPHDSCHDHGVTSHPDTARDKSQPIMCHPSLVHVCSIPGCSSCAGAEGKGTIKEPPHSLYVPASPLDTCAGVLDPTSVHLSAGPQSQIVEGPCVQQQNQDMEGPSVQQQNQAMENPSLQQSRSPAQQPEDELLRTYVMVEHDKK